MKVSKYNILKQLQNGKTIAFNSVTCALAAVNDDFLNFLENADGFKDEDLEGDKKQLVQQMLKGNYLLEDPVDEMTCLKNRNYKAKYNENKLNLVIAPTLNCNFGCPYCYENLQESSMSPAVVQGICKMIEGFASQEKNVHITWYGGEPLLEKEVIASLSKKVMAICKQNNCTYSSDMITNGYLLDDEAIDCLIAHGINRVQITLDGPPHIHDQRRYLRNMKGPTFWRVVENIKKAKDRGLFITIRINLDKNNAASIETLLDILKSEGLNTLEVIPAQVTDCTKASLEALGHCMSNEEFAKVFLNTQKLMSARGFQVDGQSFYPGIKSNYCQVDQMNSYLIDPKGLLYKCLIEIGNPQFACGTVAASGYPQALLNKMYENKMKWMRWNPLKIPECRECKLLPVCMGGCPFKAKKYKKPSCEKWKYIIEEVLEFHYHYQKEG